MTSPGSGIIWGTASGIPLANMNKKHVAVAFVVGAVAGYVLQNYIRKIPVIGSKLPVLGGN